MDSLTENRVEEIALKAIDDALEHFMSSGRNNKKYDSIVEYYAIQRIRAREYYERNKEKILLQRMKKWRETHEPAPPGGRGRPRKNIEV